MKVSWKVGGIFSRHHVSQGIQDMYAFVGGRGRPMIYLYLWTHELVNINASQALNISRDFCRYGRNFEELILPKNISFSTTLDSFT